MSHKPWSVEGEEPLRLYALTWGRTQPQVDMDISGLLRATPQAASATSLPPEAQRILAHCANEPQSVAEVAALLGRPVQLVKVVLSDLASAGLITLTAAVDGRPDVTILRSVLRGLERLDAQAG